MAASRRRAGCGGSAFPRRLFFEGQFFGTCVYSGKKAEEVPSVSAETVTTEPVETDPSKPDPEVVPPAKAAPVVSTPAPAPIKVAAPKPAAPALSDQEIQRVVGEAGRALRGN